MVAVLNSFAKVREVNIVGDCVCAVYNTPYKSDIDEVFTIAAYALTLRKLLNRHYAKKDIDPINVGIGVDWGRALMIKAGYSGSGINDVIYMGDVVNRAAHLAHEAGRSWRDPIFLGGDFQTNLSEENQKWLKSARKDAENVQEAEAVSQSQTGGASGGGIPLSRCHPLHRVHGPALG